MSLESESAPGANNESSVVREFVQSLPIFAGLDAALLAAITLEIEWFSVPGGMMLFAAGEAPDALYVVLSGSLGAYATSAEGHRRQVGRIMTGETVGEMALISGKPRNATVIALRDTEPGRLPRAAFEKLMLSHPQGLLRISQLMAQRLDSAQRQVRGRRAIPRTFAVVPNDAAVGAATFAAIDSDVPPLWRLFEWFRGRKQRVSILQILWRAGMINSAGNRAARHELSDLLLQPPLEQIDMLNWKAFDRAIEAGFGYAKSRVAEWVKARQRGRT